MNPEEFQQQIRIIRSSNISEKAKRIKYEELVGNSSVIIGCKNGRYIVRDSFGNVSYTKSITNGVLPLGEEVLAGKGTAKLERHKRTEVETTNYIPPLEVIWGFCNISFAYAKNKQAVNWTQTKINFGRYPDDSLEYPGESFVNGMFDGDIITGIINIPNTKKWIACGWSNPYSIEGSSNPNFRRYASISISNDNCKSWNPSEYQTGFLGSYFSAIEPLWTAITYDGESRLVAVGNEGLVITSDDEGATWTQRKGRNIDTNTGRNWDNIEDVAYGNGWYVLVTETAVLRISQDGINWTEKINNYIPANVYNDMRRVIYSPDIDLWLAIGLNNFYYCIPDSNTGEPATWTAVSDLGGLNLISDESLSQQSGGCVCWGKNKFVTGGLAGTMAYSSDGINWSEIVSPFGSFDNVWGIAYQEGLGWIACTQSDESSDSCYFATSTNGIVWNTKFVPSGDSSFIDFEFINRVIAIPKP